MPVKDYGVLKGRPIQKKLGAGRNPHYQVHLIDETTDYRIAVNVKSKLSPSELLYLVDDQFQHPMIHELKGLALGFTHLVREPGGASLDYIRGNLFNRENMVPLPHEVPGPDNDLNEKIDHFVERALNDSDSMIYAFGARWGPEPGRKDKYFGFLPGNGIHDIHMNQGNAEQFRSDDGVWQDGGLFIHYPHQNQWVGIFLAFQSQAWHTDDRTGHAIEVVPEPTGEMRIVAARVNPMGVDVGFETVTLINPTTESVDLSGWAIVDKNKHSDVLDGPVVKAGETAIIPLDGQGAQLGNKGGIITLLNKAGLKIDGVSYTKSQARKQGWTIVF